MDKVLIVEDNPVLLKILQSGLRKYDDRFDAVTARDGEEAIEILGKEPISLLVTDLQMPKVDGLTLLAHMNDRHPEIPCVVMSAHGTPQIKEKIAQDVLRFIEKPFEIDELVDTILPALEGDEPAGTLNGISIANFLQMIHMEQKTCLLEIETSDGKKGYFYFEEGLIFDAVYEDLNGEEAALEIIPHERAKIRFKNLAKGKKKVSRRIQKDLMALLMDAMRLKDESDSEKHLTESGDEPGETFFREDEVFFDDAPEEKENPGDELDDEFDLIDFDIDGADLETDEPGSDDAADGMVIDDVTIDDDRTGEPVGPAPSPPDPAPVVHPETAPAPSDVSSLLTGLRKVAGYRGAAVVDDTGEVLAQDTVERDLDMELFGAMVLDLIQAGRKVAGETGLGDCRELILAAESGVLLCASPAQPDAEPLNALVLLGPDGNRALAKISLKKILPALKAALA